MSRKHRRKHRSGNIKNDPAYNPFPKSGLVKQFEPYIRKVVVEFCKRYPEIGRDDFLHRAIELALAAEKTFKPELGFSFATHLGGFARNGRLRELHRLHDQFEKEQGVEIYRTKEDLAHEQAEEDGEPTAPVNFAGGGNGVRLLFDLQWWEALLSDIIRYVDPGPMLRRQRWFSLSGRYFKGGQTDNGAYLMEGRIPTTKLGHRLKLGTQLRDSDSALDVQQRLSENLPQVLKQQPPGPTLMGWLMAAVDHLIRRQREADDEAQKRLVGDHSPTFLEAIRNVIDAKFYKGRKPPRFLPQYMPMARLDDAYSHSEDGKRSLHDTIAAHEATQQELQTALEQAEAVRPMLTNPNQIAMLDRLIERVKGTQSGGLTQVAKEIGVTKGAASKMADRLAEKFKVTKRRA